MDIILKREKSERCYLEGKININNSFICDTLEFNNELTLHSGSYNISLFREPVTNERRVYILDSNKKVVSKLTNNNTYCYNNTTLRKKNQLIEIGLSNNQYGLIFFKKVDDIIQDYILKSIAKNENLQFRILNDITDNYTEDIVTTY